MNIEEINERIEICKIREYGYREADKTIQADKYSKEAYKWEQLLSQLDPKLYQTKEEYRKGYSRLENSLDEIRRILSKLAYGGNADYYMEPIKQVLGIVNKSLGDEISDQMESLRSR